MVRLLALSLSLTLGSSLVACRDNAEQETASQTTTAAAENVGDTEESQSPTQPIQIGRAHV